MTRIPGEHEDALLERVAIVAEANGWNREKAERTVAWWRKAGTWGEALRAAMEKDNG